MGEFTHTQKVGHSRRLLNARGFDEKSGIFLDLSVDVDIPDDPTSREVRAAIKTLWYPISNFPFEHRSDRAHALAMMLEPYMRDMFGPTPMYFVSKPAAGTGATLFVETALYATLMEFPNAQTPPKSDEEMKKVLTSMLLEGDRVMFFDNADNIFSASLVSALTAEKFAARLLGSSAMVRVPVQVQWVSVVRNGQVQQRKVPVYRMVYDRLPEGEFGFEEIARIAGVPPKIAISAVAGMKKYDLVRQTSRCKGRAVFARTDWLIKVATA